MLVLSRQQLQVEQQRRLQSARWSASTRQTPPHYSSSPAIPTWQPTPPRVCSPPPRTRSFCSLFAERKFSLHLRTRLITTPRVLMHHHSSVPGVHSVRAVRLIMSDTTLLGGNTAVGKTNKPERARQYSGVFEDSIFLKSGVVMATSVVVSQSARCLRLDFHHFLSFFSACKSDYLSTPQREEQILPCSSYNKRIFLEPIIPFERSLYINPGPVTFASKLLIVIREVMMLLCDTAP